MVQQLYKSLNSFKSLAYTFVFSSMLACQAYSESIFRGVKGPTDWQLDMRFSSAQKTNQAGIQSKTFTANNIIKYWTGNEHGVFAFVSIPVKSIDASVNSSTGLGDISINAGPRGRISFENGTLNYFSTLGCNLPTANSHSSPALGTNRTDVKANLSTTVLWGGQDSKKYEIDTTLDFTRTGSKSQHTSDNLYTAMVAGGQIAKKWRAVGGILYNQQLGGKDARKSLTTMRAALRYIPSKTWHLEAWVDRDIHARQMSKGTTATLALRYNLGK